MNPSNEFESLARSAWQSQPVEMPRLSVAYVQLQADRWNKSLRKEPHLMLWTAACSAVLAAVYFLLPASVFAGALEQAMALAAAIFMIGYIQSGVRMRQRLTRMRLEATDDATKLLDAYRTALEQRRDLYLEKSPWMLWPIALGAVVLMLGKAAYDPDAYLWLRLAVVIGFITTSISLGRRAAKRKAAELQREIDALAAMSAGKE